MTAIFADRELAASIAEKLKVYAQPLRLMILSCLLSGPRHVADIGATTGIGQPALSQQLAELRRADLVRTHRKSKQVWYTLADDGVRLCVQSMEAVFGGAGLAPENRRPAAAPPSADTPRAGATGIARFAQITRR